MECDDEYWEIGPDSTVTFKQPPDKPSTVTFFNCSTRLSSILASALNTLYSTKKYKVVLGLVGDQWEQRAVAELDSSLNTWIDSVPPHRKFQYASLYGCTSISRLTIQQYGGILRGRARYSSINLLHSTAPTTLSAYRSTGLSFTSLPR